MSHVPAYARELVQLRRSGLAPDGDVIVTTCWRLARAARSAEACVLVVRERDEPDLRGCYGLRVAIVLPQCSLLARTAAVGPHGLKSTPARDYLASLAMCDTAPRHELDALADLVRPIADACDKARADSARLLEYDLQLRIWRISAGQVARRAGVETKG